MTDDLANLSFEDALRELESIVRRLEGRPREFGRCNHRLRAWRGAESPL